MNDTQFEFLDNLVNRTISLKAIRFSDEIWELERAGLVSLKWDGQFFVAKPTLAGREHIERELEKRKAATISYERDVERKVALEREREEARRTENRKRNEHRFWQVAIIFAMIVSASIPTCISSCSCGLPMLAKKSNEHHGSPLNGNTIVVSPKQESPEMVTDKFDFDEPATNHAYPHPIQPSEKPKSDSGKAQTTMGLTENGTNHIDNLKETSNVIVTNSLGTSSADSRQ